MNSSGYPAVRRPEVVRTEHISVSTEGICGMWTEETEKCVAKLSFWKGTVDRVFFFSYTWTKN